jgi:DNA-binding CsgD family transcriptional regulator
MGSRTDGRVSGRYGAPPSIRPGGVDPHPAGPAAPLRQQRDTLIAALESLLHTLVVVRSDGQELHRSQRLGDMLSSDPERDCVLRAMLELARRLAASCAAGAPGAVERGPPSVEQEMATGAALYRLRAGWLAPGLVARRAAAAACAERLTPELPTAVQLRARFGLTQREAEVAHLLAAGLTNRKAADVLCISPHTVRTHAQRLFLKLDVHTRKALAVRLLAP